MSNKRTTHETPWGHADQLYEVAEGVQWVGTPGHGGLMVRQDVARRELTAEAIEHAYPGLCAGWVCFEEDCSYAVAFYERPSWEERMHEIAGGPVPAQLRNLKTISSSGPLYLLDRGQWPVRSAYVLHLSHMEQMQAAGWLKMGEAAQIAVLRDYLDNGGEFLDDAGNRYADKVARRLNVGPGIEVAERMLAAGEEDLDMESEWEDYSDALRTIV